MRSKLFFYAPLAFFALTVAVFAFPCFADNSAYDAGFVFSSGIPSYDAAYAKARGVIQADTVGDSFIAGRQWNEVWTRDTSYSVDLALALISPQVSKETLLAQKQNADGIGEVWYQDVCGHFAGWPNLTDSIVGANGAWSLYEVTGDQTLLQPAFDRTLRTLERAERDAYKPQFGLFGGCSTFMESDSAYPAKYANNGAAIADTCCLSTNLLYYRAYVVTANMAKLLGQDPTPFETKASKLETAINKYFWMPDKGYYGYFLDADGNLEPHMEGTGEAFAILYGVAGPQRAASVLKNTPTTQFGFPCEWPQYPEYLNYNTGDAMYYHNGMIWPFVEGYWAWAASESGDTATFGRELDDLVALSEKNDSFQEFYHPEDGKPDGSPNQLWSASGFLSMIYHSLFGMNFQTDGIEFTPIVPSQFQDITLKNVIYRDSVLNITVLGHGTVIKNVTIDGIRRRFAYFKASMTGPHDVVIQLAS